MGKRERDDCFTLFFLLSCDCYCRVPLVGLQCMTVFFPDHTLIHLDPFLFAYLRINNDCTYAMFTNFTKPDHMNQCMRFPTMWYVRPAKPQTSLRILAV